MTQIDASRPFCAGRGPAMAAAALAVALYAITLKGTYVYDDKYVIRDDPRVREAGQWVRLLRERYIESAPDPLFRPITSLSYAVEWRLHGDRPWAFHLVNVLLHAAVSALVAVLAARLTRNFACALAAGLIFAAHPVHVEAVAYLVGRAETLCALGIIGGLVLFCHPRMTVLRAAAITGCFVLAVLSKEHGVLLPPMILALYLVRRFVAREPAGERGDRQALKWLFVMLSFSICAYIGYRESIMRLVWDAAHMRWSVNPMIRAHGIDRMLVPVSLVGRYLSLLVWPVRLAPDYGAAVTDYRMNWLDPYWYIGLTAIVAYVAVLIWTIRRRNAAAAACLLCFAIAYSLISNWFYIIGTVMGDRLIYIGSAFFIILIAMLLAKLPPWAFVGALAVVLALACVRTVVYAWQWNDALRLFTYGRKAQPRSVYLHVLEANELMERGRLGEAEPLLAEARRLGPDVWSAWEWSALLAEKQGRPKEAETYGIRAFDLEMYPPHLDLKPPTEHARNRPTRAPAK